MTTEDIEFGLHTPVYVTVDESGRPLDGDVVIRNTIEEAVLADAVGMPRIVVSSDHWLVRAKFTASERSIVT
jgi:hypothetical protein